MKHAFLLLPFVTLILPSCLPEEPQRAQLTPTPGPGTGGPYEGPSIGNPSPPGSGTGTGTGNEPPPGSSAQTQYTCRNTILVSMTSEASSCYLTSGTSLAITGTETYTESLTRVAFETAPENCTLKAGLLFSTHFKSSIGPCQ